VLPRFSHWADLVSLETGTVEAGWYGGGMDEAQASLVESQGVVYEPVRA